MDRVIPDTSAGFVTPPAADANVFTSHGGRPIWWRDGEGRTHACEGAELQPGALSYWTLCQPDTPVDQVFHPTVRQRLTCAGCLAVIRRRKALDLALSGPASLRLH